jgi:hypothetical protein
VPTQLGSDLLAQRVRKLDRDVAGQPRLGHGLGRRASFGNSGPP